MKIVRFLIVMMTGIFLAMPLQAGFLDTLGAVVNEFQEEQQRIAQAVGDVIEKEASASSNQLSPDLARFVAVTAMYATIFRECVGHGIGGFFFGGGILASIAGFGMSAVSFAVLYRPNPKDISADFLLAFPLMGGGMLFCVGIVSAIGGYSVLQKTNSNLEHLWELKSK